MDRELIHLFSVRRFSVMYNLLLALKTRKRMQFISFFLLLTIILTACGSSQTQTGNKLHSLSIVANTNGDYSRIFSPYSSSANTGAQGMIYEPLVFYNRLDGSVQPWLAASQDISSDATTITYHLRSGVKWSDGQPFTSDDVVFTLGLLKKDPTMDFNGIWPFIKDVIAPDTSTRVVTLPTPFI